MSHSGRHVFHQNFAHTPHCARIISGSNRVRLSGGTAQYLTGSTHRSDVQKVTAMQDVPVELRSGNLNRSAIAGEHQIRQRPSLIRAE